MNYKHFIQSFKVRIVLISILLMLKVQLNLQTSMIFSADYDIAKETEVQFHDF